ncbi:MAG TPA: tetratricopeptide repeat protein [Cyclobacteriaceae bacterium]|nr:tetratricopeptide repeat protein [Cyclobacteriaceae bacterium]
MEKIKWIEEYIEQALQLVWVEGHEPAIKLLDRILYEEPGYGRLHHAMGVIYFHHVEDCKSAEVHFRMAIRFNPKFADPYWHLSQLLKQDERHDEAIEICKEGLRAKQANKSRLLESVGQAYELKKKFSKAIRHYKDALSHSAELWECKVLEENIKRCKRKQKNPR